MDQSAPVRLCLCIDENRDFMTRLSRTSLFFPWLPYPDWKPSGGVRRLARSGGGGVTSTAGGGPGRAAEGGPILAADGEQGVVLDGDLGRAEGVGHDLGGVARA